MSFGKLKRRLQAIINRKDLTDQLAADFITDAISDIERVLRIGCMEAVLTQNNWDGQRNAIVIPPDFLEGINLFTDTGELTQVDLAAFIARDERPGVPTHFVKIADRWLLSPTPVPGTNVYLHHYAQSRPLASDADENIWTQSALNAVVYKAAALAADFYQMENEHAARFAAKADTFIAEIAEQDLNEKWSGRMAVPMPANTGDF
jgi:hypothetical protein